MSDSPQRSSRTQVGPRGSESELIHRLRFELEQLSADNAHHEFEHLCRRLARVVFTPNLLPATGPVSAGGDQGADFESFPSLERAWAASPGRIAFACSLQKSPEKSKIRSDVGKICGRGDGFDRVVFFSSQDVPVSRRNRLRTWAKDEHGVDLLLLDRQALAERLAWDDVFDIAREYLKVPEGMVVRPVPRYLNERIRWLTALQMDTARRLDELLAAGKEKEAALARDELLELRRKIRRGPELKAGEVLLQGRFQLLEQIGKGGFGRVWKAHDRERQELVALKVLHGHHLEDRTPRERFFRGARWMAEIDHPGIVKVLEKECEDEGFSFFVMEYVDGEDLGQAVIKGHLNRGEALTKVLEVGEALHFAHEKGLVHRDVKPANILIGADGRPKLTDFDLVRGLEGTTGFTRTAAMMGSYVYSAPEVLSDAANARRPADVYSLGMTLLFALSGSKLPGQVVGRTGRREFIESLSLSSAMEQALLRATALRPEDRFQTVAEFLAAVRAALENPDEPRPPRPRSGRRTPRGKGREAPRRTGPVGWAEREVPDLPENRRPAAVLETVERAVPVGTDDLRTVGILAWALDYFPGRSGTAAERNKAKALRKALLEPLRKLRPPPEIGGKGWVEIPGGSFSMGSEGRHGEEAPIHEVTLSPFSMLDHPVTNRELRRLLGKVEGEDELPAVNIDWYHAYAYAAWLGGRLPTEAEWEYACRAGTTTEYWSGNEEADLARVGWYSKNSGGRLHRVGEKPSNRWGLYDMHGNVWEWTADLYDSGWYGKPEASQPNPWGPPSGVGRVVRGGSFRLGAANARSAYRVLRLPWYVWNYLGFRVVVPVAPSDGS